MLSREYTVAVALVLASILKVFGVEMGNDVLEGLVAGIAALSIAVWRKERGDIDVFGRKV